MEYLKRHMPWAVAFALAVSIVVVYEVTVAPPRDFTSGTMVRVVRGTSVPQIADDLLGAHIIQHPMLLRGLLRVSGESSSVQTGVYKFDSAQNIFVVTYRLVTGDYGIPAVRLTFIEGVTLREAASQVAEAFPYIPQGEFLSAAAGQEGYLFPDTYFFQPGVDAAAIVATMRANFTTKTASLAASIATSSHSLPDIITMASLVEEEASTSIDRRMISGILWNRVKLGMPLQVDAVFGYIFNRGTYSPSPTDLRVNSPYNTYTHIGLPPGPIGNPGLDAIEAALYPTKTVNLYYLTGNDGRMYYATTYAGHQANLRKYLK